MHMVDLASSTSLHSVTIVEPLDLIHLQVLSIDRNSGFDHFRNEKICFSTNRWVGLAETLKIDILTLAHLNIVSNYFEQKKNFQTPQICIYTCKSHDVTLGKLIFFLK